MIVRDADLQAYAEVLVKLDFTEKCVTKFVVEIVRTYFVEKYQDPVNPVLRVGMAIDARLYVASSAWMIFVCRQMESALKDARSASMTRRAIVRASAARNADATVEFVVVVQSANTVTTVHLIAVSIVDCHLQGIFCVVKAMGHARISVTMDGGDHDVTSHVTMSLTASAVRVIFPPVNASSPARQVGMVIGAIKPAVVTVKIPLVKKLAAYVLKDVTQASMDKHARVLVWIIVIHVISVPGNVLHALSLSMDKIASPTVTQIVKFQRTEVIFAIKMTDTVT